MSGTINISRRLFLSEAFRDEPFTEREAWVWLVMEASWKERTVRAGDYVADTKRGQLAASVRFMSKAWSWTAAKVQRYLKRIEKLKMICVETDTGISIVTICNYGKYQNGAQASDTVPIQDRYTTDTNEKKDSIPEVKKEKESLLPFSDFWAVWPVKIAKDAASKAWSKLSQADRIRAIDGAADWYDRWRQSNPQANPIHPASFLNQKRWTDEIQPRQLTAITGGRNDRSQSDRAINEFANQLTSGTVSIDRSNRDPFAVQRRGDT